LWSQEAEVIFGGMAVVILDFFGSSRFSISCLTLNRHRRLTHQVEASPEGGLAQPPQVEASPEGGLAQPPQVEASQEGGLAQPLQVEASPEGGLAQPPGIISQQ